MICANCKKSSENLLNSFTRLERLHLLASAAAMARSIDQGPAMDREISSSVVTKRLISFPEQEQQALLEYLKRAVGVEIKLGSCAHGIQIIS